MEFRILGPLEIRDDEGREVSLGAGRQRALLAALLVRVNEVVSIDRLVDDLWGEEPPGTAVKVIQGYISQLRKALEPSRVAGGSDGVLATRAPGYVLRVEPEQVDAGRFERLIEAGRSALAAGDSDTAARTLREALALWRGSALAEFAYEAFAQSEIARLEELRLAALGDRIEADLACGRHADLVGELEALVGRHPLQERLRGQLMLALYRAGRQADALRVFQEARRALVEELGLEPGEALQRLERAILTHDPALEAPARAAPVVGLLLEREGERDAPPQGVARAGARPGRSREPAERATPPNSVVLIDPEAEEIVGHVPVGWRPVALAFGYGSVWVANADDGTVSRIDPETREVERTIGIGAPAIDVAVGDDAVWVANGSDGTVSRIDPTSNVVVETLDLRGSNELAPNTTYAVAVDAGAVWIAVGPRSLVRIDPATSEATAAVDVGHIPVGVAVGEGAVWVATIAERALRVEVRTSAVSADVPIGYPVAMATGEGAVWVADTRGRLWCIDEDSAAVMQTIVVGRRPMGLAAADGEVWVAENHAGDVLRIDARNGRVVRAFAVGHAPTDVVVAAGAVWVSVAGEPAI